MGQGAPINCFLTVTNHSMTSQHSTVPVSLGCVLVAAFLLTGTIVWDRAVNGNSSSIPNMPRGGAAASPLSTLAPLLTHTLPADMDMRGRTKLADGKPHASTSRHSPATVFDLCMLLHQWCWCHCAVQTKIRKGNIEKKKKKKKKRKKTFL